MCFLSKNTQKYLLEYYFLYIMVKIITTIVAQQVLNKRFLLVVQPTFTHLLKYNLTYLIVLCHLT